MAMAKDQIYKLETPDRAKPMFARLTGPDPKYKFSRQFINPHNVAVEGIWRAYTWRLQPGYYWAKYSSCKQEIIKYLKVTGEGVAEISVGDVTFDFDEVWQTYGVSYNRGAIIEGKNGVRYEIIDCCLVNDDEGPVYEVKGKILGS